MPSVYVYFSQGTANHLIGTRYVDVVRGKETYSFEFDKSAIDKGYDSLLLDADLFPMLGRQYKRDPSAPYHFMEDSSPDRWGKKLLQKASLAKTWFPSDFLLGVSDKSRMGALRFSTELGGPFLADSSEIPPYRFIRELEEAAYNFEEFGDDPRWKMLLVPGSSLGGARPKATIYGTDGELYLAKFSNKNDDINLPALEYWTYLLAREAGINMMPSQYIRIDDRRGVFLTKRFDREGGERFHYVSFMTLLHAKEGDSSSYTYLDVAKEVSDNSVRPEEDLKELFRRIAFSLFVHNFDDHLRNHAMIHAGKGWRLSPAFDLNISLDKAELTIPVSKEGNDLGALIRSHAYFGLSVEEAEGIVDRMERVLRACLVSTGRQAQLPESLLKTVKSRLAF